MRIDKIPNLAAKCTGCMVCVDACPKQCISCVEGKDGFVYSAIDETKCVDCGRCYAVCPLENNKKNNGEQHLYAAYSIMSDVQNRGSSGGMFELLANHCIDNGYHVCGAAFDGTKLGHRIIKTKDELPALLKSKYVQSDTKGIYKQINELLKNGEKVFFCGTPCQVSALINSVSDSCRENLLTADIICHGVPSQKTFDMYIESLEQKHGATVSDFNFRVKDNRYKHAHGYSYKVTKGGKTSAVNGVYTQSTFYNAFKNYQIFREGCYDCRYTTLQRVSDLTLADFWGIEKYDFKGNTDKGISMVITNTQKGEQAFSAVKDKTVCKEFPVQYGVDSNYCLTNSTKKPKSRDEIIDCLATEGYESTAQKYFGGGKSLKYRLYWLIPAGVRNLLRKLRG